MKHKLLVLDVILLGALIVCGSLLRDRYNDARNREQSLLRQQIPPIPAPPITPLPAVGATRAVVYEQVAQKLVFSRDRNPNVILEPVIPPPPPVMPQLPRAHGVMAFGGTPTVILSDTPGSNHHGYRPGDKIGEFTLLAVNDTDILFEWQGLRVLRKLADITDKEAPPAQAAPAQAAAAPAQTPTTVVSKNAEPAPGLDLGNETRGCNPGDNSPPGTVANGMRKVMGQTPFGPTCRWEPVR